jgi:hypothetical protein
VTSHLWVSETSRGSLSEDDRECGAGGYTVGRYWAVSLGGGGQLVEVTVALTCAEVACPDINWVDE